MAAPRTTGGIARYEVGPIAVVGAPLRRLEFAAEPRWPSVRVGAVALAQANTMGAYHKSEPDQPLVGEAASSGLREGPTRVLLVEDERLIRITLKHELESLGYRVECAVDGNEAARIVESRLDPVDLLLTDIVVPGPTGPEIAELVRAKWPRTQVIFMSAYPRDLLLQQGRITAGQVTLEKPFTEEQLALKMREVLESA